MRNMLVISARLEFSKIISRNKNRVLLFFIAVLSLLVSTFSSGGLSVNIAGVGLKFPNGALIALETLNGIVLPLMVFMLCADIISHEFSDQTIKAVLLKPVGKAVLFISKWFAAVLFGICCLGASFVFGGLVSVVLGQMNLFSAFIAFAVSVLPLCACTAMAAMLSSAISHPSMAMFISIVIYVLLNSAGFISASWGVIFYTAHLNWYKMFLGSTSFMPVANMVNIAFMITAYTILFLIGGAAVFSRRKA